MPYFSGPNGIREVADAGDRFQQSFQDSRRKRLLSDYFSTGNADLGQLAKYDPEAAQQIQAQQKEREFGGALSKLLLAPEEQRPQGLAALIGMNPKEALPYVKAFDPRFAQAAVGGVQSTFVNDQGQRVAIMRDGSVQVLGNNAPNNQIIDTGNGYFGVNKGNLNAAPVQVGGAQNPQTPQQDVQGRRVEINYDGPADERAAFDQLVAADAGQPFAPGQYSAELPPREVQGQQLRKAPPAMTPYQQASLGMQQQKLQTAVQARDQATAARKAADDAKSFQKQQATATRQASAAAAANQLITAIDTLEKSPGFNSLGTAMGDLQIGMPVVRSDAKDADAQLKNVAGQVALATMERLKSLSAVGATGFGSLTAPELALLQNSLATLQADRISNAQLKTSLKVIKDSMAKVAQWQPQAQQSPAQSASGGRQVTRTGTQNGRKVVQYSDGSVEYAD